MPFLLFFFEALPINRSYQSGCQSGESTRMKITVSCKSKCPKKCQVIHTVGTQNILLNFSYLSLNILLIVLLLRRFCFDYIIIDVMHLQERQWYEQYEKKNLTDGEILRVKRIRLYSCLFNLSFDILRNEFWSKKKWNKVYFQYEIENSILYWI